ncbi:low temperature requirement protein LtrA [Jatrophihabitans sp. GAS493]|uniref:low temperature requirement protein A n=1 Tax=Jatrophihabitans sp. GAS493 TaxID=1907575 RepID=UPI000BB8BC3F|nr:low temperature requirement protein A [Jatrophihabitans sp. GAS493]SOD72300.1 low temperature requirement protein LtrA [Jatrophihabitans sp. GAS493]
MNLDAPVPRTFLRDQAKPASVTNIELFFDLVFVFMITQLSKHLLENLTVEGALQTALLLGLVWLTWVYTTWVTNWLDPDVVSTRIMLLAIMFGALVMASRLPVAFTTGGLVVGVSYAAIHIGRTLYVVIVLEHDTFLRRNFERILAWCCVSGTLAIAGGLVDGHAREALWLGVVVVDLLGGAVGFYTPVLGRSQAAQWSIDGGHFAERCQLFVIIALGESIVVLGETLSQLHHPTEIATFVTALVGAALLWWVYFDRSAEDAADVIAQAANPGRLGRSAYHFVHPILIGGIIVAAAGDEELLHAAHLHPHEHVEVSTVLLVCGGTALFLAGHACFKAVVWRRTPWSRLAAVVALVGLAVAGPQLAPLLLGLLTALIVLALCVYDRLYPVAALASVDSSGGAD